MDNVVQRVAVEVTRFALPALATRPRPALLDPLIRAAVLIDLALAGALTDAGDGLEIDTTTTGFAPADRLLAAVTAKPDKPLAWWLYHAPITVHDIANVLVAAGGWDRHGLLRHYRDLHPEPTASKRHNLITALRRQFMPAQAATAILLDLLPVLELRLSSGTARLFDQCGSANWIVSDLESNLRQRQALLEAAGRDARIAQSAIFFPNPIPIPQRQAADWRTDLPKVVRPVLRDSGSASAFASVEGARPPTGTRVILAIGSVRGASRTDVRSETTKVPRSGSASRSTRRGPVPRP